MKLFWLMVIVSARCSGSDEIPLDRAAQSSTYNSRVASYAIDNDLSTGALTTGEKFPWLKIFFQSRSTVKKVVVEHAHSFDAASVYTVSVYDGETETVCGTYTGKPFG